jgi:hypothetical protein
MKVIKGDIWKYWKNDAIIVIPTNGCVKKDGSLVMGRGLALQAKVYIHNIEFILGDFVKINGNIINYVRDANIIAFPVKHNWWEKADLKLIKQSCIQLNKILKSEYNPKIIPVALPKVGCGNGQLSWKDVEPILDKYLISQAVVVDLR